jgi:3,4-dihydroxy 2-butanone 4-phosphate synthase / GTP cyclohydrolase II
MALTQSTALPLKYGKFRISYHTTEAGVCVGVSYGDLTNKVPIVRLHSSCLFGESFHSLDCDCADQLDSTLKLIVKNGSGAVVYRYVEGRGIGLENKIMALELQRAQKLNTVDAFRLLGFAPDVRIYDAEIAALHDLRLNKKIAVASQNPHKLEALRRGGFTIVKTLHPFVRITQDNVRELLAKRDLLGYNIIFDLRSKGV